MSIFHGDTVAAKWMVQTNSVISLDLVGGFNPFEKHDREIGSFPKGEHLKKTFETIT